MAKIGGYKPKRREQIKKAIKELSNYHGYSINSYYKLTNNQILVYMQENRMGLQWITEGRIKKIRTTLPKMYREKNEGD
jgi:hypothetical protein